MVGNKLIFAALAAGIAALATLSFSTTTLMGPRLAASIATVVANKAAFEPTMKLNDGIDLEEFKVRGKSLRTIYGSGHKFGKPQWRAYRRLKRSGQTVENYRIQWALRDLETEQLLSTSRSAERNFYGASIAKIYVAAALLAKQDGKASRHQLQRMADLIAVSSNTAWSELQKTAGSGSYTRGQKAVDDFTRGLGYKDIRAFRGWMKNIHGNELNARDLTAFLADTYNEKYPGAQTLWQLLFTCRTGGSKALAYIPRTIPVGGKTGTFSGMTVDPLTRRAARARNHHHVIVLPAAGKFYSLAILTDRGSNAEVAVLAGGLLREYLNMKSDRAQD